MRTSENCKEHLSDVSGSCKKMTKTSRCLDWTTNTISSLIGGCLEVALVAGLISLVQRTLPLLISIWTKVDIALDIRQTIVYYNHAYQKESYFEWAEKHRNDTNSTYLHTVSELYFQSSCVIWFTAPVIFSLFFLTRDLKPFKVLNPLLKHYLKINIRANLESTTHNLNRSCFMDMSCCMKLSVGIILFPFDVLASAVWIYVIIPVAAFRRGINIAWHGKDFEEDRTIIADIRSNNIEFFKVFEFMGEAFPQLILATVFTINNYEFLFETDVHGLYSSISFASILFSAGTVFYGLLSGLPLFYRTFNDEDDLNIGVIIINKEAKKAAISAETTLLEVGVEAIADENFGEDQRRRFGKRIMRTDSDLERIMATSNGKCQISN